MKDCKGKRHSSHALQRTLHIKMSAFPGYMREDQIHGNSSEYKVLDSFCYYVVIVIERERN